MSSLERPAAAVRMITPPVKPCCSRNSRTMPRSRAALVARLDLARHADVIDRRHEDQEAARHRDVRGEARALGAERLLDDLDEDFLPFLEQVFDVAPRDGPGRPDVASRTAASRSLRRAVQPAIGARELRHRRLAARFDEHRGRASPPATGDRRAADRPRRPFEPLELLAVLTTSET